jgi:flagellar M-ring protein FliF
VNGVLAVVKAIGPTRLAAMGAVAAIMIGFFAFVMLRWNTPQMVVLAADVPLADSAQIVRELDRLQIRHELRNEGATILVSRPDLPRARMRLAEQNLPKGGGVGYEIFDRGESLGTTSFVQNLNHLRALEGELGRSIRTIDRVQAARVHLVIPERQIFARDRQEPTASIVLRLRGALEQTQVRAIQHMVAAAVPGMKPAGVSIVDEAGRLLASGRGEETAVAASSLEERRVAMETRLRQEVEDILGRVVGPGRARVQVAAELDWNRTTQTQDIFDPEQRVVRSTQTRGERSANQGGAQDRQVSVANELPGRQAQAGSGEGGTRESNERNEEITNFEISRTQRQEVTEAGRLRRVSVAVLVDGTYARQGDQVSYQPRSAEEIERLATLVRSAVGFDERRGDRVEVVNLRFAEGPSMERLPAEADAGLFAFTREDLMRLIETGVVLVLGLLVLLFGIRPLLKRVLGEDAKPEAPALAEGGAPGAPALGADGTPAPAIPPPPETSTSKALEVAALAQQMHAQSVTKIGELVQQNPIEASTIIRSWMNEKTKAA